MVPFLYLLVEGGLDRNRGDNAFATSRGFIFEHLAYQLEHALLQLFLVNVGHYRKSHIHWHEMLFCELPKLLACDLFHTGSRSENRTPERMPCEQGLLELVIDIICGGVFVGVDLIDHHTFFDGYLFFRECRAGRQLK